MTETIYPQFERQLSRLAAKNPRRRVPSIATVVAASSTLVALLIAALALTTLGHSGTPPLRQAAALGTPSRPMSGTIPGKPGRDSYAGDRYEITITPNLVAGTAGWDSQVSIVGPGGVAVGGLGGSGGYASPSSPLFGGSVDVYEMGRFSRGDTVEFVLAAADVAAIRVGTRTIRTETATGLSGDRIAVFPMPVRGPMLLTGWRPGTPITGTGPGRVANLMLVPLDAAGRSIPASRGGSTYGWSSSWWQAPARPHPGICELRDGAPRQLIPEWGHTLQTVAPVSDATDAVMVSCLSTEYYLHGWGLTAAILVDGRHPGAAPGAIPGATAVPLVPNTFNYAQGNLSARRVGDAWLVVEGPGGWRIRSEALDDLTIARLDLADRRG